MYKPFNINNFVKFKLTKEGHEILKKHDKEIELYGLKRTLDEDGYYEMSLWKVMSIFGEGCSISKNPPFKNCKIFIKEKGIFEK